MKNKVNTMFNYLREIGLNERQVTAAMYGKEKGKITNSEYQKKRMFLNQMKFNMVNNWI